jgi:hypothetical protein
MLLVYAHFICCGFTVNRMRWWSPSTRKARSRRSTGPSRSSAETGEVRNPHARLQRPRYDDPVRRGQRARWQGHRPLCAAPSPSGVHPLHRNRRAIRADRQGVLAQRRRRLLLQAHSAEASNGASFARLTTSKARSPATSPLPTGNQALRPQRDHKNHPGQAHAEPSVSISARVLPTVSILFTCRSCLR